MVKTLARLGSVLAATSALIAVLTLPATAGASRIVLAQSESGLPASPTECGPADPACNATENSDEATTGLGATGADGAGDTSSGGVGGNDGDGSGSSSGEGGTGGTSGQSDGDGGSAGESSGGGGDGG